MEKKEQFLHIDPKSLPKHFNGVDAESKWNTFWDDQMVYKYDPSKSREETFVVDSPPPTVSGSLHIGHVFSYSHTDFLTRYKRMKGFNIFYPMGWDDNGLPTERRVQNYFHVQCDTNTPYVPGIADTIEPATSKRRKERPQLLSRQNFIELCVRLTHEDEKVFKSLWQRLALSIDWDQEYTTINDHSRRMAQYSFMDLYKKGHLFMSDAPNMWDVDFQTAIAQAEVEDRPYPGHFYKLNFQLEETGQVIEIATTRPELVPACVGMTAHPDDPRFKDLFGKKVLTPLFGVPVVIFPSEEVDMEKGTGIVMVCTFGDATDVDWWKHEKLPLRQVLGRNGRFVNVEFGTEGWESVDADQANTYYENVGGKTIHSARVAIVEMLKNEQPAWQNQKALVKDPEKTDRMVKFYEKGKKPLEYIPARQWFAHTLKHKEALIKKGKEITWHPEFMQKRFEIWTENLLFDWCISRQRFFGVSIPVWYPMNEDGTVDFDHPILPEEDQLPVDPLLHLPKGYTEEQRDQPGGFTGERDVFDTWFTSSMTPQISSKWGQDQDRHQRIFPADVRPQSHEIIRTWAFYTILKAHFHEDKVPWHHAIISGWVLDPDRKKMSKSKGNVVTPSQWFDKYTTDAVRYWSAKARLGVDTTFDESVMKNGLRLVTKIYNAGKFVYGQQGTKHPITHELDKGFIQAIRNLVVEVGAAFEDYDHAKALDKVEIGFWNLLTDSFIELVKNRAFGNGGTEEERGSAIAALHLGMDILLRLFAPFLPYITEEVWSWVAAKETNESSVHKAPWPTAESLSNIEMPSDANSFQYAANCLSAIHKFKATAQVSIGKPMTNLIIKANAKTLETIQHGLDDLILAARAATHELIPTDLADGEVEIEGEFEE